jgi:hypothetical protein
MGMRRKCYKMATVNCIIQQWPSCRNHCCQGDNSLTTRTHPPCFIRNSIQLTSLSPRQQLAHLMSDNIKAQTYLKGIDPSTKTQLKSNKTWVLTHSSVFRTEKLNWRFVYSTYSHWLAFCVNIPYIVAVLEQWSKIKNVYTLFIECIFI